MHNFGTKMEQIAHQANRQVPGHAIYLDQPGRTRLGQITIMQPARPHQILARKPVLAAIETRIEETRFTVFECSQSDEDSFTQL